MSLKRPLIIAGPCSAETEQQTLATCEALAATGKVDMLRAGVWKPRTKPGTFEGMGIKALPWLAEAKRRTGLPISTEVATAKHIDEASAFDVDMFWIGARTTSSPFVMQEIAEALRGTDRPVYVKNPLNIDVELWVGAVERLAACGVKNVGLIHRGFSGYGSGVLRNTPMWHLALEIRRRLPELPMLCDPSHICGNRAYIADISQQAADLDFDGLIIESHISPETALSDASQQLTPADLVALLDGVKWRDNASQSVAYQNALDELRGRIDRLDMEYLGQMFGIGTAGFVDGNALYYLRTHIILLIIGIFCCGPFLNNRFHDLIDSHPVIAAVILTVIGVICISYLVYSSYNPFLYFRF